MNEQILTLKSKIVKLDDFFQDMASAFSVKAELKNISFLTPDNQTRNFITSFSTSRLNIKVSNKDLGLFKETLKSEIFFPQKMHWGWGLWKQIRYIKVICKIYIYSISAVMPIKGSNGICCLIVFCDRKADNWFSKNTEFTHKINQHIMFCLEAVRLYNQTLEGMIRKYNPSHQISAKQPIKTDDDEIPTLIERKVEFL